MSQPAHDDRRNHYRLQYPPSEQPTIRIDGRKLKVFDLSEGGAKVVLAGGYEPRPDQPIVAVIQFADGQTMTVEGVVLRVDQEWLTLRFTKGVSQKRMLWEQVRLRKRYPTLFERPE